jgi:hypothetical protein
MHPHSRLMFEVRSSEFDRSVPRKPRLFRNREEGAFAYQTLTLVYLWENIFLYHFLLNLMEKQSQCERFNLTSIGLSDNFLS